MCAAATHLPNYWKDSGLRQFRRRLFRTRSFLPLAVELLLEHAKRVQLGERFSVGHVLAVATDKKRYLGYAQKSDIRFVGTVEPVGVLAKFQVGIEQADALKCRPAIKARADIEGKGFTRIADIFVTAGAGIALHQLPIAMHDREIRVGAQPIDENPKIVFRP